MNTLLKHGAAAGLLALSVGCAQAQEPHLQQFLMTVSISHAGHLIAEGPLAFYSGPSEQKNSAEPTAAQYASLIETGYPAIHCSHSGDKSTRDFTSVVLKSGYSLHGSLSTEQGKIAIRVRRFDAEGATAQVLSEMKRPIQTCHTIEPHQLVSLAQTVTIPAAAGSAAVTLKNGDVLRYEVAITAP